MATMGPAGAYMSEVPYGRYEEAYRAIHSALMDITCPPPGKKVTKLAFTWNIDGSLASMKFYDASSLLFTLSFSWNSDLTLNEVART
jgi:hypothetical protein